MEPLRMETVERQQPDVRIGWFDHVEAKVSMWLNGRHVTNFSNWTKLNSAIEDAKRIVDYYGIEPGCGTVVAVTLTESEKAKVWREGSGWQWPSAYADLPCPVIKGQRLAWISDRGEITADDQFVPVRMRFQYRFPIIGEHADDEDLTPLFAATVDPLTDRAMVAYLSHNGLKVSGFSVQNIGKDKIAKDVFWAEAAGDVTFCAARVLSLEGKTWDVAHRGMLADFCMQHIRVSCFPTSNHTHWSSHATGDVQLSWNVVETFHDQSRNKPLRAWRELASHSGMSAVAP